jgi:hypothetical protein
MKDKKFYYTSVSLMRKLCQDRKNVRENRKVNLGTCAGDSDNFSNNINKSDKKKISAEPSGMSALADIDVSIHTDSFEEFDHLAKKIYYHIRLNCQHRGSIYIEKITTLSQYKYKLYGSGLPRPIDIFRMTFNPEIMVYRFHLNCVRMFYKNHVLYMYRSCMSSLVSGINEFYKWFSCTKIPADIVLKYISRGITTLLNSTEMDTLHNYITMNSAAMSTDMRLVNKNEKNTYKKLNEELYIDNDMFRGKSYIRNNLIHITSLAKTDILKTRPQSNTNANIVRNLKKCDCYNEITKILQ